MLKSASFSSYSNYIHVQYLKCCARIKDLSPSLNTQSDLMFLKLYTGVIVVCMFVCLMCLNVIYVTII